MTMCAAAALTLTLNAASRNVSYAIEDAAFQAVARLNTDIRVAKNVGRIAFVKLWLPTPGLSFKLDSSDSQVFEAGLLSVPSKFQFVVHTGHQADWAAIDAVFDQAADFESWNPATCPALNKLKLADALLMAKIIDGTENEKGGTATVRVSLRLIEVSTAQQLWGGTVEGTWRDYGPENQQLTLEARRTFEAAAKDAVAKLPASLDGYGVFLLPFEGNAGRAMTQIFLNALTAAGRQDKIFVYDLPNGNVADRQLARFLRERAGTEQVLDESILKKVESRANVSGNGKKLALLSGMVTVGNVYPKTLVDPTGFLDFITKSKTDVRENPTRYDVVADFKFRDIGDRFRVLAAVDGRGTYDRDVKDDLVNQFKAFLTARNISLTAVIVVGGLLLLVVLIILVRMMTRVR